jgi:hypothetical protein
MILLAILFFLLSPGVLFTIPKGTKGFLFSNQTSVTAVIVHTFLFIMLYSFLKHILHIRSYEGFQCGCGCQQQQQQQCGCQQQQQPRCNCIPSCKIPRPTGVKPKPNSGQNNGPNNGPNNGQNNGPKPKQKCIPPKKVTWYEYIFGNPTTIPYRL